MKTLLRTEHLAEMETRLEALGLDAVRGWGRMSVGGMVCHLTDSFLSVLGERGAPRSPKLHERTVMRWMAISTPMPWPKGVATMEAADQDKGGTPPGDFEQDKARLRAVMMRFLDRVEGGDMVHPLFGAMSVAEWGRWGYRHMDHHFRQFGG